MRGIPCFKSEESTMVTRLCFLSTYLRTFKKVFVFCTSCNNPTQNTLINCSNDECREKLIVDEQFVKIYRGEVLVVLK